MKILKSENIKIGWIIMWMMLLTTSTSFAQADASTEAIPMKMLVVLGFAFMVVIVVLMVAVMLLRVLNAMVRDQAVRRAEETGAPFVEEASIWEKLDQKILTQAVPLEDEQRIVLDHDYDGIKELDNHLPPWWKYMFYMTVVFAVVYVLIYHVFGTLPLQAQEYENEIAFAEATKASLVAEGGGPSIDENNVVYSTDEAILANGAKVYAMNCVACHKEKGEGGIGPNLTDEYWVNNGGSISHIFTAVKYGFPSKGMISWEPLLSPQQMSDVASYVKSINGTNPPNAKDPQGELYVEVVPEDAVDDNGVQTDSTLVTE
jgi:cytochrome c oxidase cbb3-type subunit 3